MAASHVVAALITKRAELVGLIEHQQKEMARLADDLAHLDATLKLFSPEIDLRTIRAKAHWVRNRFFRPGECQRMVLDIFREAQHAADDAFDIALPVVVEPEDRTARAILKRQGKAQEFRIAQGLVFLAQAQEIIDLG